MEPCFVTLEIQGSKATDNNGNQKNETIKFRDNKISNSSIAMHVWIRNECTYKKLTYVQH